jgi:hypothetical protein
MKSLFSLSFGRSLMALTLVLALFTVSCKKEAAVDTPAQQEEFANVTGESDAEAEIIFDNVFDNVAGVDTEVGIGGTGVFGGANYSGGMGQEIVSGTNGADSVRCFTVTYTQLNPPARFPLKVVMDFGTGCTGRDGRTRKGKIITVYTGPLFIPGNSTTTTFDGYYVNETKVEGTHKVLNKSTQNQRIFQVVVSGAKLSRPNGNYTQWNSEKTITQLEGLGTPLFPLDDVFKVQGGANGAVKREDKFFQWSTQIKEPLIKRFVCRWIVKGVVTMRKSNAPVADLNYGDGACDNKAVITINGVSREITLR